MNMEVVNETLSEKVNRLLNTVYGTIPVIQRHRHTDALLRAWHNALAGGSRFKPIISYATWGKLVT